MGLDILILRAIAGGLTGAPARAAAVRLVAVADTAAHLIAGTGRARDDA